MSSSQVKIFHAFANNPHGLMELGFKEPQLCTTVLPRLINLPILRTFLAPHVGRHANGHHSAGIPEWSGHLPTSLLHVTVASICGLPGKVIPIWCRSLSKWPALTHYSCTGPLRSLLKLISIIEGQRSLFQEATRSS